MTRPLTGQRNEGGAPSADFTAPVVAVGVSLAGVKTAAVWVGSLVVTAGCLPDFPAGVFAGAAATTVFELGGNCDWLRLGDLGRLLVLHARRAQTRNDDLFADMEGGLRLDVIGLGDLDHRLLVNVRNLDQRIAGRDDVDPQTIVRRRLQRGLGGSSDHRPYGRLRNRRRGGLIVARDHEALARIDRLSGAEVIGLQDCRTGHAVAVSDAIDRLAAADRHGGTAVPTPLRRWRRRTRGRRRALHRTGDFWAGRWRGMVGGKAPAPACGFIMGSGCGGRGGHRAARGRRRQRVRTRRVRPARSEPALSR